MGGCSRGFSTRPSKRGLIARIAFSRKWYIRLKIVQIHFQWRGDRWPCWIRFRLFPRASALSERCTVVDTVSKQYRTPPHSPIRARAQKCQLGIDAREESVSGACVPTAGMKARGRANRLIDLVLSPTIDHTQRAFTKRTSWHGRFFLLHPLLEPL